MSNGCALDKTKLKFKKNALPVIFVSGLSNDKKISIFYNAMHSCNSQKINGNCSDIQVCPFD